MAIFVLGRMAEALPNSKRSLFESFKKWRDRQQHEDKPPSDLIFYYDKSWRHETGPQTAYYYSSRSTKKKNTQDSYYYATPGVVGHDTISLAKLYSDLIGNAHRHERSTSISLLSDVESTTESLAQSDIALPAALSHAPLSEVGVSVPFGNGFLSLEDLLVFEALRISNPLQDVRAEIARIRNSVVDVRGNDITGPPGVKQLEYPGYPYRPSSRLDTNIDMVHGNTPSSSPEADFIDTQNALMGPNNGRQTHSCIYEPMTHINTMCNCYPPHSNARNQSYAFNEVNQACREVKTTLNKNSSGCYANHTPPHEERESLRRTAQSPHEVISTVSRRNATLDAGARECYRGRTVRFADMDGRSSVNGLGVVHAITGCDSDQNVNSELSSRSQLQSTDSPPAESDYSNSVITNKPVSSGLDSDRGSVEGSSARLLPFGNKNRTSDGYSSNFADQDGVYVTLPRSKGLKDISVEQSPPTMTQVSDYTPIQSLRLGQPTGQVVYSKVAKRPVLYHAQSWSRETSFPVPSANYSSLSRNNNCWSEYGTLPRDVGTPQHNGGLRRLSSVTSTYSDYSSLQKRKRDLEFYGCGYCHSVECAGCHGESMYDSLQRAYRPKHQSHPTARPKFSLELEPSAFDFGLPKEPERNNNVNYITHNGHDTFPRDNSNSPQKRSSNMGNLETGGYYREPRSSSYTYTPNHQSISEEPSGETPSQPVKKTVKFSTSSDYSEYHDLPLVTEVFKAEPIARREWNKIRNLVKAVASVKLSKPSNIFRRRTSVSGRTDAEVTNDTPSSSCECCHDSAMKCPDSFNRKVQAARSFESLLAAGTRIPSVDLGDGNVQVC